MQVKNAKKQRKPIALSPIYVDFTEYNKKGRSTIAKLLARLSTSSQMGYLKVIGRAVKNGEFHTGTINLILKGYGRAIKEILDMSNILLPNSFSEMKRIERDFGIYDRPFLVVPHGVDTEIFDP